MSDNIFGTTPTSTLISVAEVALKVMQGKSPIKEDWFKDEAEKVEHKWKRFNTKLRVKWLAQIKVMAKKEDMSQEELDDRLDDYGLVKFPREKVWDEAEKIKPKWKKMSTSARIKWLDDLDDIAKKTHTSHADVEAILDDAKLKKEEVEEEVELTELLKSKDKSVIDAFYKEDSLVGRVLSTDGKSLEKHGVGGQTIAAWLKDKIAITAVSDVKSTESILKYMKNSIPKLNFDPKSYKKFFEEVELDESEANDKRNAAINVGIDLRTYLKKDKWFNFELEKIRDILLKGKLPQVKDMPDDDKSKKVILKLMKNNMKNKFAKRYKGYSSAFDTWITEESELTESTTTDKKNTFTMAPFEDLRSVADAALKIMTRQPQEVKEEEKEEVTKEDQPQTLTEQIV